jgi:hypothetical protein
LQSRDFDNLNDSIVLIINTEDNIKNEGILVKKALPHYNNDIDNKIINLLNSEESDRTERIMIENDDLFDNFGFNQIKI